MKNKCGCLPLGCQDFFKRRGSIEVVDLNEEGKELNYGLIDLCA